MARPQSAYFGTDMPDPMFMRTAGEPLPQSRPPGGLPAVGQELGAEMPHEREQDAGDGYEEAIDYIDQMASDYMGVDTSTLDDQGYTKMLQDLRAGYPNDTTLLGAIDFVEKQRRQTGAMMGMDDPAMGPGEMPQYTPDRPR